MIGSLYPFSDRTFGSLALSTASADGITESLATGEEYYDDNRDSGRLALRFLPRDNVTVDWTADFTRERERAAEVSLLSLNFDIPILAFYNKVTSAAGFTPYDERFITGDLRQSFSDEPNFSHGDVAGTALTVGWTSGDVEVRSITSYRELEYDISNDLDGATIPYAFRPTLTTQEQITQEIQLLGVAADDRLDWVVGGLYFSEESQERSRGDLLGGLFEALEATPGPIYAPPGLPDFLCNPGPPPPGLPCLGGAGNPFNFIFFDDPDQRGVDDLTTDSWAIFGETTYAASDRVSLTFGLRYTDESKDYLLREIPGPNGNHAAADAFQRRQLGRTDAAASASLSRPSPSSSSTPRSPTVSRVAASTACGAARPPPCWNRSTPRRSGPTRSASRAISSRTACGSTAPPSSTTTPICS